MLTHLDLFSGIGGFALACEWAGFKTIGFVEIDKYCQKVLRKHWPDVPIVEDIRDVEKIKKIVDDSTSRAMRDDSENQRQAARKVDTSSGPSSLCRTPKRGNGTIGKPPITLITGGFPCQPFSVAGKRGGKEDNRYLWPAMFNVINEIRPSWVLGENVAGIVRMELDHCLSDLEGIGYSTQTFIIPACAVNAPHRRDRVWIVANSIGRRCWSSGESPKLGTVCGGGQDNTMQTEKPSDVADTKKQHSYECDNNRRSRPKQRPESGNCAEEDRPISSWWAAEPELGRVAHGIPNRVDRLKCLGNAIVPQAAYQILKGIAELA